MHGLVVMEGMTLSGHLSNIDESSGVRINFWWRAWNLYVWVKKNNVKETEIITYPRQTRRGRVELVQIEQILFGIFVR